MTNQASDPTAPLSEGSLDVFIADDSQLVQRFLTSALGRIPGLNLAGRAFNGHETVKRVRESEPHVLILDIEMPKGNGLEVIKALMTDDARPHIFALTLYASPELQRRCLDLGADRFFDKENDFPLLLESISELAHQAPRSRLRAAAVRHKYFHPPHHKTQPTPRDP